mmetsp:Transcript_104901/g.279094  ORF Transcript_104901/g.279094 Transcript_104901/m.279094 type:complete len:281 (+) Transcript_104901:66-908(+)
MHKPSATNPIMHTLGNLLQKLVVVNDSILLGVDLGESRVQVRALVGGGLADGLQQSQQLPLVDAPRAAGVLVPDHAQDLALADVGAPEGALALPLEHPTVDLGKALRARAGDAVPHPPRDLPQKLVPVDHPVTLGVPLRECRIEIGPFVLRGLVDGQEQVEQLPLVDLPVVRHSKDAPQRLQDNQLVLGGALEVPCHPAPKHGRVHLGEALVEEYPLVRDDVLGVDVVVAVDHDLPEGAPRLHPVPEDGLEAPLQAAPLQLVGVRPHLVGVAHVPEGRAA